MINNRITLTLGDLGGVVTGKTPSTKVFENFGGDIPFVTPSDMDGRKMIDTTERYLSNKGAKSVNCLIPAGSIMVSCIGSDMGKVAIAGQTSVTNQQINSITVDEEKFCKDYIYYNLSIRKQEFQALAGGGSAQPILNKGHFSKIRIDLPPLSEQRAIAYVLGTLDDKIELNRKMNETLEGMARAIFKSWFVDFDPVRAKAEGRQPFGMDAETADLFPDSFEDSPLGKIPKGWRVATIQELTSNIQYGLTQSAASEPIGPKFLRITDIQGGRVDWGTVPYCKVSSEEHDRYRLKAGDILVARTGASTGENIYLSVVPDAVFASYLVRFQFANSAYGRLVGAFMRTQDYFDHVAGCIGGSAQPNASAQVLASAQLVVPSDDIVRGFAKILLPLDIKIGVNNEEFRVLVAIRDVLLPPLINGEFRIQ